MVGVLTANPEGLRAEQIRELLGLQAKELPRPLADGLKSGVLSKSGQKRATVYTTGSGVVSSTPKAAKKRAAKAKRVSKKK